MTGLFTSAMATDMAAFIEFKRSMGVAFTGGEYCLRRFDAYCTLHGFTGLTREALEGFVADHEADKSAADRSWLSYLRGFARWLQAHGEGDAHILSDRFGQAQRRPVPYLLSTVEIDAFFEAAAEFDYPAPWSWQAKAFFGVMLALGLRTCEARRLACTDINLNAGTVDIRWSKGPRSRRLFINTAVAQLLATCDRRNHQFTPNRITFFVSGWGNQVSNSTPGIVFQRLWRQADLAMSSHGPAPRPYAFRHHFAYANIERWQAEGKDPAAMMPYLARYMGHASIDSTFYYLHVSPDFLGDYIRNFTASAGLLPEVGFDG
jgi:integrase